MLKTLVDLEELNKAKGWFRNPHEEEWKPYAPVILPAVVTPAQVKKWVDGDLVLIRQECKRPDTTQNTMLPLKWVLKPWSELKGQWIKSKDETRFGDKIGPIKWNNILDLYGQGKLLPLPPRSVVCLMAKIWSPDYLHLLDDPRFAGSMQEAFDWKHPRRMQQEKSQIEAATREAQKKSTDVPKNPLQLRKVASQGSNCGEVPPWRRSRENKSPEPTMKPSLEEDDSDKSSWNSGNEIEPLSRENKSPEPTMKPSLEKDDSDEPSWNSGNAIEPLAKEEKREDKEEEKPQYSEQPKTPSEDEQQSEDEFPAHWKESKPSEDKWEEKKSSEDEWEIRGTSESSVSISSEPKGVWTRNSLDQESGPGKVTDLDQESGLEVRAEVIPEDLEVVDQEQSGKRTRSAARSASRSASRNASRSASRSASHHTKSRSSSSSPSRGTRYSRVTKTPASSPTICPSSSSPSPSPPKRQKTAESETSAAELKEPLSWHVLQCIVYTCCLYDNVCAKICRTQLQLIT